MEMGWAAMQAEERRSARQGRDDDAKAEAEERARQVGCSLGFQPNPGVPCGSSVGADLPPGCSKDGRHRRWSARIRWAGQQCFWGSCSGVWSLSFVTNHAMLPQAAKRERLAAAKARRRLEG